MFVLGLLLLLLYNGAFIVGSQHEGIPLVGASPENVTVHIIDPKTVEIFWSGTWKNVERYDVTYNPTEDRVITQAAGNSHSVVLHELRPNTQYQVTVSAVINGKNYRSRRLVFKTGNDSNEFLGLESVKSGPTKPTKPVKWTSTIPEIINPDPTAIGSKYTPQTSTTVRGVEVGLVLLALVVWIIAIALFFHRWGKIRMLLPYQPDYKTQQSLKVPGGTGASMTSGRSGTNGTPGQQEGPGCVQHLRWSLRHFDERSSTANKFSPTKWTSRARVSSVIFPASPSFFQGTSLDCDSPRRLRQGPSRGHFSAEAIPLCQVTQPRSEKPNANVISYNVPVISCDVNERAHNNTNSNNNSSISSNNSSSNNNNNNNNKRCKSNKPTEQKLKNCVSLDFDDRKNEEINKVSTGTDKNYSFRGVLSAHRSRGCPREERSLAHLANLTRQETKEYQNDDTTVGEEESVFVVGAESGGRQFAPARNEISETSGECEKPKRYSRSSLRKQKTRYYDDRDLESWNHVPSVEYIGDTVQDRGFRDPHLTSRQKPSESKTAEMKRKTFLRKISLQDTYLNYNQDYWLDFKKSRRFHNSIDLGYFGNLEDMARGQKENERKTNDKVVQVCIWPEGDRPPPPPPPSQTDEHYFPGVQAKSERKRATKATATATAEVDSLTRCDSDPLVFSDRESFSNSSHSVGGGKYDGGSRMEFGMLMEVMNGFRSKPEANKRKHGGSGSWFLFPSNENIPLFSERTGLIETDFDVLDGTFAWDRQETESSSQLFPEGTCQLDFSNIFDSRKESRESANGEENGFFPRTQEPPDFGHFYEIKITESSNSEEDGEGEGASGDEHRKFIWGKH